MMRPPRDATAGPRRLLEGYTLITFITGAVVMGVELVGARMLAPHFGATLYAWTAVIAITLVGLTAGYALGGRISDRPAARPLALLLLLAGGFLIALPGFDAAFISLARGLGIRLGALLAALGVLMIPLTALAAVGPIVVAELGRGGLAPGRAAGRIMAVSTLGSVTGTLATGFWLLPGLAIDQILGLCGGVLTLAGLYPCARGPSRGRRALAALLLIAAALGAWRAASSPPLPTNVIFRANGEHGEVKVVRSSQVQWLVVDNIAQAALNVDGGSDWDYLYTLVGQARLAADHLDRALVIGAGGGLLSDLLRRCGVSVDEVELDPVVARAADEHFKPRLGLFPLLTPRDRSPGERRWIADGRTRLRELAGAEYDLIAIDAYSGESAPAHLLSVEALRAASAALRPGGLAALNLVDDRGGPLLCSAWTTLSAAVGPALAFATRPAESRSQNFILLARRGAKPPRPLHTEIAVPAPYDRFHPRWTWQEPLALSDGRLITDRHGPDPAWDLTVREAWRRSTWTYWPRHVLEGR